jgi:hypothetical protein
MILNYGVLEGSGGTIDLTEFGRIDELPLGGDVEVPGLPDDYRARWTGFGALSNWRQANLAGDFSVVAPVLEAMYRDATGEDVDGVLQIDPGGLAGMLEGLGPVVVPEVGEVSAENVVGLTLNEAYLRFPGVEQRTDVLGDVAEAAFRRLVDGEVPSLRALARGLVKAVDGRHLLVHAGSHDAAVDLEAFGAGGTLPPIDQTDSFHLTAQNLAGNKLDYYLDTALRLTGSLEAGGVGELQAEIVLHNDAPAGATQPAYVYGPGPTAVPLPAGVLRSVVTLYLPFGTSLESSTGDELVGSVTTGTEAGRPFGSFTVDLPAGATRTVVLSLRTPPKPSADHLFLIVPSPFVRPTSVDVRVGTDAGDLVGAVELGSTWAFAAGRAPAEVVPPAFR